MQTTITVINPMNNEEVEVTLDVNVSVVISNESRVLNIAAFGLKELS